MKFIFSFFFFFFNTLAFCANTASLQVAKISFTGSDGRWLESEMRTYPSEHGEVYAQTFTRYIYEIGKPFELGNISYFSVPITDKTKNINSAIEVKTAFEKMFDLNPFHLSNHKGKANQWLLEGEYKKHGRYVRLIITKHSSRFSFTISYLRKPYLGSTELSSLWIQDRVIEREEKFIKGELPRKSTFIDLLLPRAYAAPNGSKDLGSEYPCDGPAPLPTTSGTTCPSPATCPPLTPTTTAAYNNCMDAIANCRTEQLLEAQKAIDARVHSVQVDLNCQSEWWSSKLDEHSYFWGKKADRALNLMEGVLSPLGIAGLAAGGVVGATVASMGMNLAISGIQSGAEALWRLVSGAAAEEEHQEILKLFMENKEKWDAMNDEAMQLSTKIDQAVDLLEFVQLSGKSLEQILLESQKKVVDLEIQVEDAEDRYKALRDQHRDSSGEACVGEARDELATLKMDLRNLVGQIENVEGIKKDHGSFDQMCIRLSHNLEKLLEMEGDLQNARVLMLKSYDHFQIEEDRRRDDLREAGKELQIENAKETLKEELKRADKSFLKGVQSLKSRDLEDALSKASWSCYKDHIRKNGWHNIICRVPIFSAIPVLGGIPKEKDSGIESACFYYKNKCEQASERESYLEIVAEEKMENLSPKKRSEFAKALRQYEGLAGSYKQDREAAQKTYEQKTKTQDFLHYNEETSRAKSESIHNWMMNLRLEQACSNVPTNCDDKAYDDMFTEMRSGDNVYNNEIIEKVITDGSPQINCRCKHEGFNCNCDKIKKTDYFKCRQTRAECDSNKQSLVCYNLPYCPPKEDGSTQHCEAFCPKISPSCIYSKTETCLNHKEANRLCREQFKNCAENKLQTGCEIHFSQKCTGSQEFCDTFTKVCRDQSLNRAKFRFEKIRAQSDLIKKGACKEALR